MKWGTFHTFLLNLQQSYCCTELNCNGTFKRTPLVVLTLLGGGLVMKQVIVKAIYMWQGWRFIFVPLLMLYEGWQSRQACLIRGDSLWKSLRWGCSFPPAANITSLPLADMQAPGSSKKQNFLCDAFVMFPSCQGRRCIWSVKFRFLQRCFLRAINQGSLSSASHLHSSTFPQTNMTQG